MVVSTRLLACFAIVGLCASCSSLEDEVAADSAGKAKVAGEVDSSAPTAGAQLPGRTSPGVNW